MTNHRMAFVLRASTVVTVGMALPLALYTVVRTVVLAELPCPAPDRTALVFGPNTTKGLDRGGLSGPDLRDLASRVHSIEALAAVVVLPDRPIQFPEGVENVTAAYASDGLATVLGVHLTMGRWFSADESRQGPPTAVIVGRHFWKTRLGGDKGVVGTVLHTPRPVKVIGVNDPIPVLGLLYQQEPDLIYPASTQREWIRRDNRLFQGLVRVRAGTPWRSVQLDIEKTGAELSQLYPSGVERPSVRILPLKQAILGHSQQMIWALFFASCVVWAVAAGNFGMLLAARLEERDTDFQIRRALGAGVVHLWCQTIKDVLPAMGIGIAVGTAAASAGLRIIGLHAGWFGIPGLSNARLDCSALLFSVGVVLGIGVIGGA